MKAAPGLRDAAAPAALLDAAAATAPRCGDPLRAFRWITGPGPAAADYLKLLLAQAPGEQVGAAAADAHGASALATGGLAAFESRVLGRPLARLSEIVAWGPRPATGVLRRAVAGALGELRARGARHVIASAMTDDTEVHDALAAHGFREIARKRSYYCSPADRAAMRPLAPRHRVRPATGADLPLLRGFAGRFEYSQYRHVPGVTGADVTRLYEAWIERALDGEFASEVLVVELGGRAAGFFAFKIDDTLHALTGKRLLRHGLTAVDSGHTALFSDLILGLQRYVMDGGGDGVQFDFYAQNSPVERMFERFCCYPAAHIVVYLGDAAAGGGAGTAR